VTIRGEARDPGAMSKVETRYICQECGAEHARHFGRCPGCDAWDSLIAEAVSSVAASQPPSAPADAVPVATISSRPSARLATSIDEFDRVLGGGVVPGSAVLIAGDPGIGKSTLLLEAAAALASQGSDVLYATSEESLEQVRLRSERLGPMPAGLLVSAATEVDAIEARAAAVAPALLIVDSIQTMHDPALDAAPGSVTQVRQAASRLVRFAKLSETAVILVGHVTKEGAIAGPRLLEHMVDTVLYLEGERFHLYRILRSVKNRFGSTNEVGIFEMQEKGLVEVKNPSEAFLSERLPSAAGSVVAVTMEGTRPLLVEIQALTSATSSGLPRRTANGIDFNRLLLLVAVLSKRVGLRLASQDVFVNVVGGLRINEPAADLGVAAAIASSFRGVPIPDDCVMIGEIGLSGELRSVGQAEKRLREAEKLGFQRCIVPRSLRLGGRAAQETKGRPAVGVTLLPARSLGEALDIAFESQAPQ
jgi:DNA repair protein RadA/Sms